jgi:hypothetical protein
MMVASDMMRGLGWTNARSNVAALVALPGILGSRWRIQSRRKRSARMIEAMLYREMPPLQRARFKKLGWLK